MVKAALPIMRSPKSKFIRLVSGDRQNPTGRVFFIQSAPERFISELHITCTGGRSRNAHRHTFLLLKSLKRRLLPRIRMRVSSPAEVGSAGSKALRAGLRYEFYEQSGASIAIASPTCSQD